MNSFGNKNSIKYALQARIRSINIQFSRDKDLMAFIMSKKNIRLYIFSFLSIHSDSFFKVNHCNFFAFCICRCTLSPPHTHCKMRWWIYKIREENNERVMGITHERSFFSAPCTSKINTQISLYLISQQPPCHNIYICIFEVNIILLFFFLPLYDWWFLIYNFQSLWRTKSNCP